MAGELRRQRRMKHGKLFWGAVASIGVIVGLVSGSIAIFDQAQEVWRDPLRVTFDHVRAGRYDGIVSDFDPDRSPTYYIEENKIIYTRTRVVIEVDRQENAGEELVRVAPYLVVAVEEVKRIPQTVDFIFQTELGGAGGVARPFEATLSPERNAVFGAPQSASLPDPMYPDRAPEDAPDFFTLAPGEGETFILNFKEPTPGHYYHFRVGVQYSYKNKEDVYWSQDFVTGVPRKVGAVWTYRNSQEKFLKHELLTELYPRFVYPRFKSSGASLSSRVERSVARNIRHEEEAMRTYPAIFALPRGPAHHER